MTDGLLTDGLIITFIGMFAVFFFLYILVLVVSLTSKTIPWTNKICPMAKEEESKPTAKNNNIEAEIAIAISAVKARF